MTRKIDVDEFTAQPRLALIGVSRSGKKFSNRAREELVSRGCQVYAVNREGGNLGEDKIYASLADLPEAVDAALVMVRPESAADAARQCRDAGIQRVWFQKGAESAEALRVCQEAGMQVVSGECILMYAGKSDFHRWHRFFRDLLGKKLE